VTNHNELIDALPDPPAIRSRLSELAAEADLLRALLRLWERRECGQRVLRRRRRSEGVTRAHQ
jgi:hypothetical protein